VAPVNHLDDQNQIVHNESMIPNNTAVVPVDAEMIDLTIENE